MLATAYLRCAASVTMTGRNELSNRKEGMIIFIIIVLEDLCKDQAHVQLVDNGCRAGISVVCACGIAQVWIPR